MIFVVVIFVVQSPYVLDNHDEIGEEGIGFLLHQQMDDLDGVSIPTPKIQKVL